MLEMVNIRRPNASEREAVGTYSARESHRNTPIVKPEKWRRNGSVDMLRPSLARKTWSKLLGLNILEHSRQSGSNR